MKKYEQLSVLSKAISVCLIGHVNPDTDAFSSMIVLRDFIKEHFLIKRVDVFAETKEVTEYYMPIIEKSKINNGLKHYEYAIMMDSPNTERLGIYKNLFINAKHKIVIDHHSTNLYEGDIHIVENCSSTCEIVYEILKHFKYKLNKQQFGKIYAGLITDTQNFSVGALTPRTFKIASDCLPHINYQNIHNHFINTNSLKNLQLLSLAIQNTVSLNHGHIVISQISHEEAKRFKVTYDDFIGITNKLSNINTAYLTCFIYPKDNQYYVSMRAKNGFDVSIIAKKHGGGGHVGAAAFLSNDSILNIEQLIMGEFLQQLSKKTVKTNNNPFN